MALTKEDLNKIALEYHNEDVLQDKFIEDAVQVYSQDWTFQQLKGCTSILELGYGEGHFTKKLIDNGLQVTLIDGSDILLQKAKSLFKDKIEIVHSLFEDYSPSKKFDCILAGHILEHVDDPITLLLNMKQWIKPTGKIIIIVPNKESIHRQLAVIMGLQPALDTLGTRDKLVGHQRVYSIETLSKDITDAGLKVKESTGFFLKTLPNSMMLGYSKELIDALNKISTLLPKEILANIGVVATL